MGTVGFRGKSVDILKGPFDPGGQPVLESPNQLLLGLFAWNLTAGATISKAVLKDPERSQHFWRWDIAQTLLREADALGFEFQIPFGRWLGHGGVTRFNEDQLDFLSTAAALAPITQRIMLFSTAHVTYGFHPIHFAKFGATIDHISGGRWGLNVVAGWIRDEQLLFGQEFPDHEQRYKIADEFVTLVKWLWASDEPITFEGEFFRSFGAYVSPKPVRKPRPFLVNAGTSPTGIDFAARHCDWIFCSGDITEMKSTTLAVHEHAERYQRRIDSMTFAYIVPGETDAQAQEKYEWLASEIDEEAADTFVLRALEGLRSAGYSPSKLEESSSNVRGRVGESFYRKMALGLGGIPIVGSPQTIAEQLRAISQEGRQRGVLFSFFDFPEGLKVMRERILPILRRMGLRQ